MANEVGLEIPVGVISVLVLVLVGKILRRRKRRRRYRSLWICPYLKERDGKGDVVDLKNNARSRRENKEPLMTKLQRNPGCFENYFRMDERLFNIILEKVTPLICWNDTTMRQAISPEQRLAVTLRYLASGNSYADLYYSFRISTAALTMIIPETCGAIYEALKTEYIKMPYNEVRWNQISNEFWKRWNFPNVLGCLDGKHVVMRKPWHAGSYYHNYKGSESIVLLAMCDSELKFLYVSVGANGRISDGGVFGASGLAEALEQQTLNIPSAQKLPNCDTELPYVILADEAFPLKKYLLKPYSRRDLNYQKKIFNYRLSRARRTIENAFGIMAGTWRVFQSKIALQPIGATKIALACCALHNFLRVHDAPAARVQSAQTEVERSRHGERVEISGLGGFMGVGGNPGRSSHAIRDEFCHYFNNEGAVEWQAKMI